MFIKVAMDYSSPQGCGGYKNWIQKLASQRWPGRVIAWNVLKGEVQAEIVRSHWRVDCPFCAGAIFVQPGEPYFCPDCMMQANNFHPMKVIWPENRTAIEAVLVKRPDPLTRNWLPAKGETLAMLKAENEAHGVPS